MTTTVTCTHIHHHASDCKTCASAIEFFDVRFMDLLDNVLAMLPPEEEASDLGILDIKSIKKEIISMEASVHFLLTLY